MEGGAEMMIKLLGACLLAFLFSAVFGKTYVHWLRKKSFSQPLKDEVAQIYKERSNDGNDET